MHQALLPTKPCVSPLPYSLAQTLMNLELAFSLDWLDNKFPRTFSSSLQSPVLEMQMLVLL